jgi:ribonuclease R
VPIDSLRDDRYTWRENTHEIIGERWGRRFRAGDRVQVILDRILVQERRLQFSIVEEGISLSGKPASKSLSKGKKKNRKPDPKSIARSKKKPPQKHKRH